MSESLGEAMDRLECDVETLPPSFARWRLRRKLRRIRGKLDLKRMEALRRYWRGW